MGLRVRVLGELSAAVDGSPATLPADARARELLGWLAVHPGPHSRSTVAGRLRPDGAEDSARQTLRNAIYELRRALGDGALDATRTHVALTAARVDLWEFRRLHEAGELEAAAKAAGVSGGRADLLPGLDVDWVLAAREE